MRLHGLLLIVQSKLARIKTDLAEPTPDQVEALSHAAALWALLRKKLACGTRSVPRVDTWTCGGSLEVTLVWTSAPSEEAAPREVTATAFEDLQGLTVLLAYTLSAEEGTAGVTELADLGNFPTAWISLIREVTTEEKEGQHGKQLRGAL